MMYKRVEEFRVDPITQNVEIMSVRIIPILDSKNSKNFVSVTGSITQSTFTSYVIGYPSNGELSNYLKQGDKIKVKYKDIIVSIEIASVKGRLSGLSRIVQSREFFREFNIPDKIVLIYDPSSKLLELKR